MKSIESIGIELFIAKFAILVEFFLIAFLMVFFSMRANEHEAKVKKLEERLGVIMFALDIKEMPDGTMERHAEH